MEGGIQVDDRAPNQPQDKPSSQTGAQARLDAFADAETLRLALKITKSGNPQCYVDGAWATARMRDGDELGAYISALYAARAAFIACPGLR